LSGNRPPPIAVKKLEEETYKNAAAAAGLVFKVFLAGPFIETTGKKPGSGEKNKAKRLRFDLYHRLGDIGWVVTMGEYDKLVSATHALLGKRNTASSSEIIHARQHADAVVMLPSSPGSFLELGAFALYPDICSKMLIIVDKKHELDPPNYLKLGPLISSQHNGAKLLYLDYGSTEDCWAVVKEFVDDQGNRVAERKLLSP
jgi:hypothetical protein